MVTASQPEQWEWKAPYEAALFETDATKLPQRIADAQRIVTERLRCLDGTVSDEERRALLEARNVLCDLCKMAGIAETRILPVAEPD